MEAGISYLLTAEFIVELLLANGWLLVFEGRGWPQVEQKRFLPDHLQLHASLFLLNRNPFAYFLKLPHC